MGWILGFLLMSPGRVLSPRPFLLDSLGMRYVGGWQQGPMRALALDTSRQLAYVGKGHRMVVVDLQDSLHPQEISHYDQIYGGIRVLRYDPASQRLYMGASSDLLILNLRDSLAPTLLAHYPFPHTITDITFRDSLRLFVATTDSLYILDVQNVTSPSVLGSWGDASPTHLCTNPPYTIRAVKVRGSYAFLGMDCRGVIVLDVSVPANPVYIVNPDSVHTHYTSDLVINGNALYSIEGNVQIYDISGLPSVTHVGTHTIWFQSFTNRAALLDSLLVIGGVYGFYAMDVSSPFAPFSLDSLMWDRVLDVAIHRNVLYAVSRSSGLSLHDLSGVEHFVQLWVMNPGHNVYWISNLVVRDSLLYVINSQFTSNPDPMMLVMNVRSPQKPPILVGILPRQEWDYNGYSDAVFNGPILYIAKVDFHGGSSGALFVVNVARPDSPYVVRKLQAGNGIPSGVSLRDETQLQRVGNVLYMLTKPGNFLTFDVTVADSPVFLDKLNLSNPTWSWYGGTSFRVVGPYAYIARDTFTNPKIESMMWIVDVSRPDSLQIVGATPVLASASISRMVKGDSVLYAYSRDSLVVFDVSSPLNPVRQNVLDLPDLCPGWSHPAYSPEGYLASSNLDTAWIGQSCTLHFFNVQQPGQPQEVIRIKPSGSNLYQVTPLIQGRFMIAAKKDTLIGYANPQIPPPAQSFPMISHVRAPDLAYSVARYDHYAVGGYRTGFRIWDILDPANPVVVSFVSLPAPVVDLEVKDTLLFALVKWGPAGTPDQNALYVYSIRNPASPVLLDSLSNLREPADVEIQDTVAYLADAFADSLFLIAISHPDTLQVIQSLYLGDHPSSVSVRGRLVYVGGFTKIFRVSVADPAHPQLLDWVIVKSNSPVPVLVKAKDTSLVYALDTDSSLLKIYVFPSTGWPFLAGTYSFSSHANRMILSPPYLFVGTRGALRALDVSDSSAPQEAGYYVFDGNVKDLAFNGNEVLAITEWNGLHIFEVLFATGTAEERSPHPDRLFQVMPGGVRLLPTRHSRGWLVFMDVLGRRVRRVSLTGRPQTIWLVPGMYFWRLEGPIRRRGRLVIVR